MEGAQRRRDLEARCAWATSVREEVAAECERLSKCLSTLSVALRDSPGEVRFGETGIYTAPGFVIISAEDLNLAKLKKLTDTLREADDAIALFERQLRELEVKP